MSVARHAVRLSRIDRASKRLVREDVAVAGDNPHGSSVAEQPSSLASARRHGRVARFERNTGPERRMVPIANVGLQNLRLVAAEE